SEALQALRLGHEEAARAAPARSDISLHGCARLSEFTRRIVRAIAVGTPALNKGDAAACSRVFRQTASLILADIGADQGCSPVAERLQSALSEAAEQPEAAAVWTLRRVFDELMSATAEREQSVG